MRRLLALLSFLLFATVAHAQCPNLYAGGFGTPGTGVGEFNSPQRITTDRSCNRYVVDTGNHRIQKFAASGAWVASFGTLGSAFGQFNNPRGAAVDSLGNIYVVDTNNNRIQKFNSAFVWQWSTGTLGAGAGQLNGAQGIAVDPTGTYLYVAEYTNNRISKFTTGGLYVSSWASTSVTDVAVDVAGNVYATSFTLNRVTKYGSTGTVLTFWGSAGTGNGQLSQPQGVAVDRYGNVFVADAGNKRVERFSTTGTFGATFGSSGTGTGQFSDLFGLAVDTTGTILVPDPAANRVSNWAAVPVSIKLSSTPNPVVHGVEWTLDARVAPSSSKGNVHFRIGQTVDGTAAIASGVATVHKLNNVTAGNYDYIAQYDGSAFCGGAMTASYMHVVSKATLSLALTASLYPVGVDQSTTFRASVNAHSGLLATGTIQFAVNGVPQGAPVSLVNEVASTSIVRAVSGNCVVTATYSGDTNYLAGAAQQFNLSVLARQTMPTLVQAVGGGGSLPGQLGTVKSLAFDADDNLYAADTYYNIVHEFRRNGSFLRRFSTSDLFLSGIAVDASGNLFVGHMWLPIKKYSPTGEVLATWTGTDGLYPGMDAIAVGQDGNVFIVDSQNSKVDEYSSSGVFVGALFASGGGAGTVSQPTGIAINSSNNRYVSDRSGRVLHVGPSGAIPGEWACPGHVAGIAVDHWDDVWVSLYNEKKIQKFSYWGALLGEISTPSEPAGLSFDGSGALYVAMPVDHVIRKYVMAQIVTSVKDVPNDQGRAVRLRFTNHGSDVSWATHPIQSYQVYRQIPATPGVARPERAGIAAPNGTSLLGWDYVLTMPATADSVYQVVVPTLADSSGVGAGTTTFLVRAVTDLPSMYYDSAPATGWSVDNLAPAMPVPFTAAYTGGGTHLHWSRCDAADFWHYKLYRGASPAFVPGPGNVIAAPNDTGYVDTGAAGAYYKLTAVDVNGNESPAALVSPTSTTDVGDGSHAALAFALDRVSPNPSRGGAIRVQCSLALADRATLELLDVAGRVVASREVAGAGPHAVELSQGRRLAPGLYLLRLAQGAQSRTQRVVVID
ncbi:MAG: Ig-like domain repeat protein [Candidatus Eisenbacteria bacterium]|nr:Ig-like domain repeat protein [Candidatus Eisenbacteria bacterium]